VGAIVDAFKQEFAEKKGIPKFLAVSSRTSATRFTLRVLAVDYGDEVVAAGVPAKVIKKLDDEST
jgi:dTDP-4-amino-4,6-dideoxygalactose transaminase